MNIDPIAREMVDVEPSSDLEARIRARVRDARPTRTMAWRGWTIGAPLATAAAIVIAVVVQGPGSRVQGPGSRVQSPGTSVSVQVSRNPDVVSSRSPKFPSSPVARVRTSLLAKVPTSTLSDAELAWMERRMPALDPVSALQVEHLRVDSIQPAPLAITPLTMTPVGTDGAGIERRNDR